MTVWRDWRASSRFLDGEVVMPVSTEEVEVMAGAMALVATGASRVVRAESRSVTGTTAQGNARQCLMRGP